MNEALKIMASSGDLQFTVVIIAIVIGCIICSFFKWAAYAYRGRKEK